MPLKTKAEKILKFITDKDYRFIISSVKGWKKNMPDDKFLKRMYKIHTGRELDLESPKTYT